MIEKDGGLFMNYGAIALAYCEQYGIVKYKVEKGVLIYNVSYPAYLSNPRYTIQHKVDLATGNHTSQKLARYNKNGEYNRG